MLIRHSRERSLDPKGRSWFGFTAPRSEENAESSPNRLARLVLNAWHRRVDASNEAEQVIRPDPIELACDFLANPREPHTGDFVRSCTILLLRSRYEILYNPTAINGLRSAYDLLRRRLEAPPNRRRPIAAEPNVSFLVDLLVLGGWFPRQLPRQSLDRFYRGFGEFILGVGRRARIGLEEEVLTWSDVDRVPEFATVVNAAFTQTSGVPGFDDITGGLLAPPSTEVPRRGQTGQATSGLVTLVSGPPGSGKTSLCLALAVHMAETGSVVRYITIEESADVLRAKARNSLGRLADALVLPDEALGQDVPDRLDTTPLTLIEVPRFDAVDGQGFRSLESIASQLRTEFARAENIERVVLNIREALYLAFPRVVVIDSLTALMGVQADAREPVDREHRAAVRRQLAGVLHQLRAMSFCVFLIGGKEDWDDEGLTYLVDNVFRLDLDREASNRYPARTIGVEKTRHQASSRGTHVFHLGGASGCHVSPSLHSVLARLRVRQPIPPDASSRVWVWGPKEQLDLPGIGGAPSSLALLDRSQVLIYGRGSSGKAGFALSLAFDARIPANEPNLTSRAARSVRRELAEAAKAYFKRARILVLSFLYEREYYEEIARMIGRRHAFRGQQSVARRVDVVSFYPGAIAAETVLATAQRRIRSAELSGRPYTTVIIDGVHNILMQFPLLEREPLLWPTLNRVLRTAGVNSVTTFTFFHVHAPTQARTRLEEFSTGIDVLNRAQAATIPTTPLSVAQQLFFHLLVSTCDYTFRMERSQIEQSGDLSGPIRVRLESGIGNVARAAREASWDEDLLRPIGDQ